MYWGLDQLLMFSTVWVGGAVALALALKLTRKSSRRVRILVCALLLAIGFTPSIVVAHGIALAPAILVLVVAPFVPPAGPSYAALLGALPIAVAWLLTSAVWAIAAR